VIVRKKEQVRECKGKVKNSRDPRIEVAISEGQQPGTSAGRIAVLWRGKEGMGEGCGI
jgi:hypothetical protein